MSSRDPLRGRILCVLPISVFILEFQATTGCRAGCVKHMWFFVDVKEFQKKSSMRIRLYNPRNHHSLSFESSPLSFPLILPGLDSWREDQAMGNEGGETQNLNQ